MEKILTVSILGVGSRGGEAYGRYINRLSEKYKIVALCDINKEKLTKYSKAFGVDVKNCYLSEDEFFKEKRSDIILICTLDLDHYRHAMKAIRHGYDILLEKPISPIKEELESLKEEACRCNSRIIVCHVLRYTLMIKKIKDLLDGNEIGKLIFVDHIENVGFWHQAHSYVRGNWRNTDDTTPMIMAKCCHDLDLLQYFIGAKCKSVSSYGNLSFFYSDNKPADAAEKCLDCRYIDTCSYSAKKIYIDMWRTEGSPDNLWPFNAITCEYPLTEDALLKAIKETNYGRCVFMCDNNAVDNQVLIMKFENNITANLRMIAFTKKGGRHITFYGSHGEIILDEADGVIIIKKFSGDDTVIKISDMEVDRSGHGGGDKRMIDMMYGKLTDEACGIDTSLENSIESHLIALAAELSRKNNGAAVNIHL